jgi:benzoate-CoA ligase family protein
MLMADSADFITVYLAAMRIGAVPVPVSTMLYAADIAVLLADSHARVMAVSPEFAQLAGDAVTRLEDPSELRAIVVSGASATDLVAGRPVLSLEELIAGGPGAVEPYPTTADSPAFWLYTSGTTGTPKGAMHRHGSIPVVCETYGMQVLGIEATDHCLSAAKGFFAYGLGNSLLFPLSVGATTIMEAAPSTPDLMASRAAQFGATLFFGGPTFFASMLRTDTPVASFSTVRLATSAGEALPADLYRRWTERFGIEILDGLGMTEMLHIFLSNQNGKVRPGTTGTAVPGYELRIVDDDGVDVTRGTPGTLLVRGASAATGYWSRYDASRIVFQGEWLRTGDTYVEDDEGYYTCLGRTGDMLKSSGIWVSPAEVEDCLIAHEAVDRAVVVAAPDVDGLEKPVAYVIVAIGREVAEEELIELCRVTLPAFKRPRRIVFVESFPTTATGKVRRVELRAMAESLLVLPVSAVNPSS